MVRTTADGSSGQLRAADKSSRTTTRLPDSAASRTKCDPTKPAPPVTRIESRALIARRLPPVTPAEAIVTCDQPAQLPAVSGSLEQPIAKLLDVGVRDLRVSLDHPACVRKRQLATDDLGTLVARESDLMDGV